MDAANATPSQRHSSLVVPLHLLVSCPCTVCVTGQAANSLGVSSVLSQPSRTASPPAYSAHRRSGCLPGAKSPSHDDRCGGDPVSAGPTPGLSLHPATTPHCDWLFSSPQPLPATPCSQAAACFFLLREEVISLSSPTWSPVNPPTW